MPSIRYRTGDLVKVKKGSCPCGRTFRVLEAGVIGRKDEMVIVRGVNVFPNVLKNIVESYVQAGDEYQIEAFKEKGIDEIAIKVEIKDEDKREEIKRSVQDEIKRKLNLRIEVKVVPKGTLPKSDFKAKRFVDRRKATSNTLI
jgi:phenylacetate-CoA ligase